MEKFESQQYRDDLAKEIKSESDKEKRKEVLAEAQKTEEYMKAKDIHKVEQQQVERKNDIERILSPEDTEKILVENCLKLFERLDCRDYCRLDWRLDSNGTPKLLEVNPNPGWCWDGHLAKMAKLVDMSYSLSWSLSPGDCSASGK